MKLSITERQALVAEALTLYAKRDDFELDENQWHATDINGKGFDLCAYTCSQEGTWSVVVYPIYENFAGVFTNTDVDPVVLISTCEVVQGTHSIEELAK